MGAKSHYLPICGHACLDDQTETINALIRVQSHYPQFETFRQDFTTCCCTILMFPYKLICSLILMIMGLLNCLVSCFFLVLTTGHDEEDTECMSCHHNYTFCGCRTCFLMVPCAFSDNYSRFTKLGHEMIHEEGFRFNLSTSSCCSICYSRGTPNYIGTVESTITWYNLCTAGFLKFWINIFNVLCIPIRTVMFCCWLIPESKPETKSPPV